MNHRIPWILWLLITMAILLSTRNPFILLIVLSCLFVLGASLSKKKGQPNWVKQNLRFLLTMILLSTLINTLFTHTGRTVIFEIPEKWILIGGDITLESVIYGIINGLVIGSLYITFNIINLALSIKQLTHLIPRAFHPISMTVTIALTFFPSIQQRAREIKEAQMIRGNQMKRISDWLPLLMPLLVTSLENAFLLSESMTSRGFHSRQHSISQEFSVIVMIIATFAIFSGWILRLYNYPALISILLYFIGGSTIFLILVIIGHQSNITHYHEEKWQNKDILAMIILGLLIAVWTGLNFAGCAPSLSYSPYPVLVIPPLQPIGFVLSLVPLLPYIFFHD